MADFKPCIARSPAYCGTPCLLTHVAKTMSMRPRSVRAAGRRGSRCRKAALSATRPRGNGARPAKMQPWQRTGLTRTGAPKQKPEARVLHQVSLTTLVEELSNPPPSSNSKAPKKQWTLDHAQNLELESPENRLETLLNLLELHHDYLSSARGCKLYFGKARHLDGAGGPTHWQK